MCVGILGSILNGKFVSLGTPGDIGDIQEGLEIIRQVSKVFFCGIRPILVVFSV